MFRFLRFFAGAAIAATLLAVPFMISSAGNSTNTVSVIVEFRDDPGAVYAAKLKSSGALPSNDQVQTYRNSLTAAQDQFLNALHSSGINFQLQTVAVKDAAGNVAGNVALRYTLAYNGISLTVPESAVPTIANMSDVKRVHANGVLHPNLFKSVPYIGAAKNIENRILHCLLRFRRKRREILESHGELRRRSFTRQNQVGEFRGG